jgi:hypothetical protein
MYAEFITPVEYVLEPMQRVGFLSAELCVVRGFV